MEDPPLEPDWKTLFDMQHYGIPTRLLDWTESFAIAVAFAVLDRESDSDESAAVFVLDPLSLNRFAGQSDIKKIGGTFRYKSIYWHHDPVTADKPLAVAPPKKYYNDRMAGQRATFTVHGEDSRSVDAICPDVVVKVTLPGRAINGAKEFLAEVLVNECTSFPDIFGMAQYLRKKHLRRLAS